MRKEGREGGREGERERGRERGREKGSTKRKGYGVPDKRGALVSVKAGAACEDGNCFFACCDIDNKRVR